MKKHVLAAAAALVLAACASPPDAKPQAAAEPRATAASKCAAPPAELVKRDLKEGTGETIETRYAIMVHYTGWLYDGCAPDFKGEMFDTSTTRGAPFGLIVGGGRVIKGWDEGLAGMKVGGKRLLVIPPDKGYGAAVAGGGKIPANSTLVFEVDAISILQKPRAP
ncbi:MAG TPA: FKBP-type peptidyl-prolyl cis-trans isomerase [Usitatibacter sp.]|nr:FKBP-type peptidyl-prolyl cis-trans isomerase [Usitatibacter sp.]